MTQQVGPVTPSGIHLDRAVLDDLRFRLASARWPTPATRPGWSDGADQKVVRELANRWQHGFSWPHREASLNRHRHEVVEVDGVQMHAMVAAHATSRGALPLVAIHGWPSTFEQMAPLADRLPARDNGMTVIAPSLPGFGFSSAPADPGWDLQRTAGAVHELVGRLGHDRYLVRATDYGVGIALHLGALFPDHVAGVHVGGTHLAAPDDDQLPGDLSEEERVFIGEARRWHEAEGAYIDLQSTKPESLALALSDSPIGLLGWLVEKYRTWCATPDDVFASIDADTILSTATIYWATNSIGASLRLYREDRLGSPVPRSLAPVAISQPALEEYVVPEAWWRRLQPVVRHTQLAGAAHFPEWESPDALADDIAAFAASVQ